MLVPAVLMVSTIRFRSFKTIDLQTRRSYKILLVVAITFFAIATEPKWTLVALAYGYLVSPSWGWPDCASAGAGRRLLRQRRAAARRGPTRGAGQG